MGDSQQSDVAPFSDVPPRNREEPPYEGALSRTTLETVHVPASDGSLRTVEVYRIINVLTDPALRESALAGRLHEAAPGETLALSFVYHDPALCKFALVVPDALRHHALQEHAKLLARLADDTTHPIPSYVRTCTVLIGHEALRHFLDEAGLVHDAYTYTTASGASEIPSAAVDGDGQNRVEELRVLLADREKRLRSREERIRTRAERLTGREDELRTLEERLIAWERDIMMREHMLVTRERDLAEGLMVDGPALEAEVQDVDQDDEDDELEDQDEYGSFRTSPHLQLSDSVELLDEPSLGIGTESDADDALTDGDSVEDDDGPDSDEEADASPQDVEDIAGTESYLPEDQGSAVHPLVTRKDRARSQTEDEALSASELAALLGDANPATSQIATVMVRFVSLGDGASVPLIDSLSSPKGVVRHACALALGELRVRQAIPPLIALFQEEQTEIWQEVARLLPLFGPPALRACVRAIRDLNGGGERFAYALAQFAEHGYSAQVEQLRTDANAKVARIVRDSASERELARRHEQMVRGELPVETGDAMRAFSRQFYGELAKAGEDGSQPR